MAEVSYQTIDADGTVDGGTVQVEDLTDLGQADRVAREAAGDSVSVEVTTAWTTDGRELVKEWEDTWADEL